MASHNDQSHLVTNFLDYDTRTKLGDVKLSSRDNVPVGLASYNRLTGPR